MEGIIFRMITSILETVIYWIDVISGKMISLLSLDTFNLFNSKNHNVELASLVNGLRILGVVIIALVFLYHLITKVFINIDETDGLSQIRVAQIIKKYFIALIMILAGVGFGLNVINSITSQVITNSQKILTANVSNECLGNTNYSSADQALCFVDSSSKKTLRADISKFYNASGYDVLRDKVNSAQDIKWNDMAHSIGRNNNGDSTDYQTTNQIKQLVKGGKGSFSSVYQPYLIDSNGGYRYIFNGGLYVAVLLLLGVSKLVLAFLYFKLFIFYCKQSFMVYFSAGNYLKEGGEGLFNNITKLFSISFVNFGIQIFLMLGGSFMTILSNADNALFNQISGETMILVSMVIICYAYAKFLPRMIIEFLSMFGWNANEIGSLMMFGGESGLSMISDSFRKTKSMVGNKKNQFNKAKSSINKIKDLF